MGSEMTRRADEQDRGIGAPFPQQRRGAAADEERDRAAQEAMAVLALSRGHRQARGVASSWRRAGSRSRPCCGARPSASVRARVVVLAQPVADAVAGAALDAPELFDVDVDQLARPLALVALGRLQARAGRGGPSRSGAGCPRPSRAGCPSSAAISGPVNRSRRSAAIASIRCSSVRLATTRGALLRSSRPLSGKRGSEPPTSHRFFRLVSAAAAAALIDQPCSSTLQHHPTPLRQ